MVDSLASFASGNVPSVIINDLPLARVTLSHAASLVHSCAINHMSGLVSTPNFDHLRLLQNIEGFSHTYGQSALFFCDSQVLRLLVNLSYQQRMLPERVSGTDLLQSVLGMRPSLRVFIVGSTPTIVASAWQKNGFPAIVVGQDVAPDCDPHDPEWTVALRRAVQLSEANLVLLCLSSPKKEFIYTNALTSLPCVVLGIGGAIDMLAGTRRRAPLWIQALGFEWFYRLAQEPQRLSRRYYECAKLLPNLLVKALLRRI